MNTIDIRPCTITGISRVLPLLESQGDAFDYQTKRQIIQKATKIVEESPKNPTLWLAVHEGAVVGFIGFLIDIENPQSAELFGQVVKHGYQGQSVGTHLLQVGMQNLEDRGVNQILIHLKASAAPYIHKFYQKAGFKQSFNEDFTGASDENTTMILNLG
jgi:GNAT superfamily N-acetyltransferase